MENNQGFIALFDGYEILPKDNIINLKESSNEKEELPKEFIVIKFGKNRYTIDGEEGEFDFTEEDADRIIDEFNKRGRDLLIDLEHACLIPGNPAPAYGWVRRLKKGRDGLIAELARWTEEAKELLKNRKYRYHSPTIYFQEIDGRNVPASLHSITLTNHPALHNIQELMAANDLNDLKESVEDKIHEFRKVISKIDIELHKLYEAKAFNDINYLSGLQESFADNMRRFSDYLHNNLKDEEAEKIHSDFSAMLFLSDVVNRAKIIVSSNKDNPEQAEIMLVRIIEDEGDNLTESEKDYINALIEQLRQDIKMKNFIDNKQQVVKPQNKKEKIMNLKEDIEKLVSFADGDITPEDMAALGINEELPTGGEAETKEVSTEENPQDILDQVKDLVRSIVDQLKQVADVLGIKPEETENVEAMCDKAVGKIKEMQAAFDKIASAYDSENKDPKALADLVFVSQLGAPDKEEIKSLKEKLAMSDKALKEKAAREAVDAAIQAGNIPESKREKALKFALNDLEKFNEHFAPGKGIPVVPVENKQEKPENQEEKKHVLTLSDETLRIAKSAGIDINDEEELKKYFS